jgi:hypothetical protein
MKVILISLTVALAGCATVNYTPPPSVAAMPNDCANQVAMINWLMSQATIPRHPLESEQNYEISRAQFRQRAWHVRYHCRPA